MWITWSPTKVLRGGYYFKFTRAPLTRFALRFTVTSTRSAILMNGMPLFIPICLRSKAIVPLTVSTPSSRGGSVNVSLSCLVTPRIVKSPSKRNRVGTGLFDFCGVGT